MLCKYVSISGFENQDSCKTVNLRKLKNLYIKGGFQWLGNVIFAEKGLCLVVQ